MHLVPNRGHISRVHAQSRHYCPNYENPNSRIYGNLLGQFQLDKLDKQRNVSLPINTVFSPR